MPARLPHAGTPGFVSPAERVRLVRLCALLAGDAEAAEDLAQETLTEAWRNLHKLEDPAGRYQWLSAIARHVCLRWARHRGRTLACSGAADRTGDGVPLPLGDTTADAFDLEVELERHELAELLDRALALLSPDTRLVLVESYIRETRQADIAAHLGVSEGAVKLRVHRGKLALRRLLTTTFRQEAEAYGVVESAEGGWQETRIWCWGCGTRRLGGRWSGTHTVLELRCAHCGPSPTDRFIYVDERSIPSVFQGVTGFKAAYTRVLKWSGGYVQPGQRTAPCLSCGVPAVLRQGTKEGVLAAAHNPIYLPCSVHCDACGKVVPDSVAGRIMTLPEARRFWHDHGRIRLLPGRAVEAAGSPAIITSFQSVTGRAQLDVVSARDAFDIISIHGVSTLHGTG